MTTPLSQGRDSRAGERGWALLETIASAVLLIVVAMVVASSLDVASDASAQNKGRAVAASLAEQDQERMRSMSATALSNYHPAPTTVTSGGVSYTVGSRADWIRDSSGDVESCTAKSGQPEYLRITSTVTSNVVGRAIDPVVERGIVAPPVGFGAGQGTLTIQVLDRNNKPVEGVPVTAQKPASSQLSDVTNSLGCAVFGYIPTGAYTAIATAGGGVDRDGNPSASGQDTVTQGNVTTIQLIYDRAGSVAVTLDGPAPTNLKLTLAHAPQAPRTIPVTAGATGTTASGLFPFTDAPYSFYAGSCTDANPTSYGGTAPTATVTPGGTTALSAALHLPPLAVTVTKNGLPIKANVKITSTVAGCTDSATVTTDNSGVVTVPMPYGHYTVCADDRGSPARRASSTVSNDKSAGAPAAVNITNALIGSC